MQSAVTSRAKYFKQQTIKANAVHKCHNLRYLELEHSDFRKNLDLGNYLQNQVRAKKIKLCKDFVLLLNPGSPPWGSCNTSLTALSLKWRNPPSPLPDSFFGLFREQNGRSNFLWTCFFLSYFLSLSILTFSLHSLLPFSLFLAFLFFLSVFLSFTLPLPFLSYYCLLNSVFIFIYFLLAFFA